MLFDRLHEECLVIAEVAQTHDGSLGTAHAYIDAVAETGANCIKFQTHIAAAESTPSEPWRIRFSPQDGTRYDYWKRMEFTEQQWHGLADHAHRRGLAFLSSPFSIEAVELLERVGVLGWKVGAGELTNTTMLELLTRTRKPVILSSGLSRWDELDVAVDVVRRSGASVAVLQCTSMYPCPPEKLGLNVLDTLRKRYACPVGLSDHSATIYAGLAAVTLGSKILEVHVTFSRECFGPDVCSSITTGELRQLVQGVRFIDRATRNPVDKEELAGELTPTRAIFQKSVAVLRELPAGWTLSAADVGLRKPGTGMPPARLADVMTRKLKRAVAANTLIVEEDLE